jgi:hypothetical protein
MTKIAILTDSTANLPVEWVEKNNVRVIPLKIHWGNDTFLDGVDLTPNEFYTRLAHSKSLPTTSQPSIQDFLQAFESLADQADGIVVPLISSGISGTSGTFTLLTEGGEPVADITQPAQGQVLTTPSVMVRGTAYDTDLSFWQLSWQLDGSGTWTPLSPPHTNPVQDGDLETWDLSGLADGTYYLKLHAEDTGGLSSEDIVSVVVERVNPAAEITWPEQGGGAGGIASILGTAWDGNFLRYRLLYGEGENPAVWFPIPAIPGALAVQQPLFSYPQGLYVNSTTRDLAQTFKTGGGYVDKVSLLLDRSGSTEAEIGLRICTCSGSVPTFNAVAISNTTRRICDLDTTKAWYDFEFQGTQLTAGTQYCLVLTRLDGQTDAANNARWYYKSQNPYADGVRYLYKGTSWYAYTAADHSFRIYLNSAADLYHTQPVQAGELGDWNTLETAGGVHTLKLEAEDAYIHTTTDQVTCEVDRICPEAVISSPTATTVVGGEVAIAGTATDAHFLKYQLFYGEGTNPQTWLPVTEEVFTPVEEGSLGTWDTAGLDGTYTLKLRVEDEATLVSEARVTLSVDNTPPQAVISSPAGEAVSGLVYIEGEASDPNFASYSISYTQDDPANPDALWTELESSTQAPGTVLSALDTEGMAEVPIGIRLEVEDSVGNTATALSSAVPDNTYPVAYLSKPDEGRVLGTVNIEGVAHDANLSGYSLLFEFGGEEYLLEEATQGTGTHPELLYSWNTTGLCDGEYTLILHAEDTGGRLTTTIRQVHVDNAPPAGNIQIMGKDASGEYTNTGFTKLRLSAEDSEYMKIWNYNGDPDYVPEDTYLINANGGSYTGVLTRDWMFADTKRPAIEGEKVVRGQLRGADGAA